MTTSTHITNFGRFANHLSRLADLDGYVPLAGARAEDHSYEEPNGFGDETFWSEHVDRCVALVRAVEARVSAWQDRS